MRFYARGRIVRGNEVFSLTEDQAKVIARLKVGQAIVCGIQDDMASWVKVAYTPMPKLQ